MFTNFIQFLFLSLTVFIISGSYVVHLSDGYYISTIFKPLLYYGKVLESNAHIITRKYEVPKRLFKHFYILAVTITSIAFICTIYLYFYNCNVPEVIYVILDLLLGSSRTSVVSAESTVIAIILMQLHCWKRLYESHCISVYSDAKMNLLHYILGFIHYIGTTCSIIGESYGFVRGTSDSFNWHKLNLMHYICSIIFLLASYEQMQTNFILANLRKDHNGKVVTKSYKIPYGRLFKYISTPLQFTEIILYLMLNIILWESSSFKYVHIFVIVNQADAALSTHRWLCKTFTNYPKQRKILIPYLL